jgi:hypothetical protein
VTAGQAVALVLFAIAAVLTAIGWTRPLDMRVPLLLASLGGVVLCLDAGGVFD